jgi:hypothetical protein
MRRRAVVLPLLLLIVAGMACAVAGFTALISTGAIGGGALGVAPQSTFNLVADWICPRDSVLEFYSVKRSYHRPGESEPHLECVAPDGTSQDVFLSGVLAVLGLSFGVVFIAVFILFFVPAAFLAFVLFRKSGS